MESKVTNLTIFQGSPDVKSVEKIDLYDLDDADNLYKKYMKKFNKKNSTDEYERTVHYYRFLKTLVEMNRDHYKGTNKKLDPNADIVKSPNDYVY
ncbi:hypothetical protein ABMA28_015040 [Loxostege sticticalis]|uniref:Cathepsin propeptide inhibitor domain-containing protein n=1 Tax=Loxostege sticticalis TaxID=481309 RepID=A0ABD0TE12_LOXSC